MFVNTGVSIFNKYVDNNKNIIFKKHYIKNAFWDDIKTVKQTLGYDKDNKVKIYVPKSKNDFSNYVKPKQFNGKNWTINEGDFIVRGIVEENEVENIKSLNKYNDVFTIMSIDDKDFGSYKMRHFEIIGK